MSKDLRGLEKVEGYAAVVVPGGGLGDDMEMLLQINEHTFGLDRQKALETGLAILRAAREAGWLPDPRTEEAVL
jgi:hypothetical protein